MDDHSADRSGADDRENGRFGTDGTEMRRLEKDVRGTGIWPIPGFRSGVWWKMLLAVMGYLFIIYLSLTVEFEKDAGRPLVLWTDRVLVFISMLFTVAVYTDYHGAAAKIPFLCHKKRWVRRFGYCMVWPFTYAILLFFEEIVLSVIQAILKI